MICHTPPNVPAYFSGRCLTFSSSLVSRITAPGPHLDPVASPKDAHRRTLMRSRALISVNRRFPIISEVAAGASPPRKARALGKERLVLGHLDVTQRRGLLVDLNFVQPRDVPIGEVAVGPSPPRKSRALLGQRLALGDGLGEEVAERRGFTDFGQ